MPGTHFDLRRVPETVPDAVRQKAGFAADDTPVAAPADLEAYDAIIFGTPTLFGMMAGQMKSFLDQAGGLWARNARVGKVAAVFASTVCRQVSDRPECVDIDAMRIAPFDYLQGMTAALRDHCPRLCLGGAAGQPPTRQHGLGAAGPDAGEDRLNKLRKRNSECAV
ncbi:NADPH-dependent FMN reductase [Maritimibacter sp. HL-12]|nr:NADPH-dependent FMN reductase [Maritimibacter sp. HL-12]